MKNSSFILQSIACFWLSLGFSSPLFGVVYLSPFQLFYSGGSGGGGSDPNFSSVVLLAHFDGTNGNTGPFTDNSPIARTITSNNGAALSTTSPKFGTASLFTDGTNDYASCAASADFSFGTSTDFTIDFWLNADSTDPSGAGIGLDNYSLYVTLISGTLYFGNGGVNMVTTSWTGLYDSWQFVSARRNGSSFELFVNGVSKGTYNGSLTVGASNSRLTIGYTAISGFYSKSYTDDVRITKGVARPNAVPTAAFPDS